MKTKYCIRDIRCDIRSISKQNLITDMRSHIGYIFRSNLEKVLFFFPLSYSIVIDSNVSFIFVVLGFVCRIFHTKNPFVVMFKCRSPSIIPLVQP